MATINLQNLIKAQKNYVQARDQALHAATGQADPQKVVAAQRSSLLSYLQARVRLLADAKKETLQQFDDEIGKLQVRIGELEQQIEQDNQTAPSGEPPITGVATSTADRAPSERKPPDSSATKPDG